MEEMITNEEYLMKHVKKAERELRKLALPYSRYKFVDIDEINFSADGLKSSYEYGEWTPGTDSSIEVIGLQMKEYTSKRDGRKYEIPSRALIGFQY